MNKLFYFASVAALFFSTCISQQSQAQMVVPDETGCWYMYFWNWQHNKSTLGVQGDFQYRAWDLGGDFQQLMLRGGLTWSPETVDAKFTVGYANITSGIYGESKETFVENRFYTEALLPHQIHRRVYLTHRFRYELRYPEAGENQTRYRYNLFMNVALNKPSMEQGTIYLALYNELFIHGEWAARMNENASMFDRNRAYVALGYGLRDNLRVQLGYMNQTEAHSDKAQYQISLHHDI